MTETKFNPALPDRAMFQSQIENLALHRPTTMPTTFLHGLPSFGYSHAYRLCVLSLVTQCNFSVKKAEAYAVSFTPIFLNDRKGKVAAIRLVGPLMDRVFSVRLRRGSFNMAQVAGNCLDARDYFVQARWNDRKEAMKNKIQHGKYLAEFDRYLDRHENLSVELNLHKGAPKYAVEIRELSQKDALAICDHLEVFIDL